MTQFGEHLAESAEQALAWARGGDVPGMIVHEAAPAIDVRPVRCRTGSFRPSSHATLASRSGPCATGSKASAPPGGPARVLLRVIDAEPEAALRALGKAA